MTSLSLPPALPHQPFSFLSFSKSQSLFPLFPLISVCVLSASCHSSRLSVSLPLSVILTHLSHPPSLSLHLSPFPHHVSRSLSVVSPAAFPLPRSLWHFGGNLILNCLVFPRISFGPSLALTQRQTAADRAKNSKHTDPALSPFFSFQGGISIFFLLSHPPHPLPLFFFFVFCPRQRSLINISPGSAPLHPLPRILHAITIDFPPTPLECYPIIMAAQLPVCLGKSCRVWRSDIVIKKPVGNGSLCSRKQDTSIYVFVYYIRWRFYFRPGKSIKCGD